MDYVVWVRRRFVRRLGAPARIRPDRYSRFHARDEHLELVVPTASANRDESVFADPTAFDIRRSPNPHVGFGFGTHVCLGAPLARFELGLRFERLSKRITNLRIIEGPDLDESIFVTPVRSLRLGFDMR